MLYNVINIACLYVYYGNISIQWKSREDCCIIYINYANFPTFPLTPTTITFKYIHVSTDRSPTRPQQATGEPD